MSVLIYFLVSIVITMIVSSQMLIKYGARTLYFPKTLTAYEIGKMALLNLTNPFVIASLFFTLSAGLTWLLILKQIPLSKAYPLISLNYVFVFALSWFLFNEQISAASLGGIVCIVLGIVLLGLK